MAVERLRSDAHSDSRESASCDFIENRRRSNAQRPDDAVAVVRVDEACAFERTSQHRLEGPVERRIAGAVVEIRDHHGNRFRVRRA